MQTIVLLRRSSLRRVGWPSRAADEEAQRGRPESVDLGGGSGLRLVGRLAAPCGKLYRARSRLYRNEILQVNMRLKALAEIYTIHSFAQL